MKTNGKHEVNAGIARQSLVLAALLAVALAFAGTSFAQSNGAAVPQPAGAKAAQPAKAAASSPAAPAAKTRRGTGEGIQIYGQWTIEVHNRDGSVAKHVEFENALDPTFGAYALAGMLSGNRTPGAWAIGIVADPNACVNGGTPYEFGCFIISSAAAAWVQLFSCSASLVQASPQPFCYDTLTYSLTGPIDNAPYTQFTLSGQAYVDTATSISAVDTWEMPCGSGSATVTASSTSPSACLPSIGANTLLEFTEYDFGEVGSCGGSGQPLCPIQVQVGQIVSATVQFSFSSPSSSSSASASNLARPHSILVKPLSGEPTGIRTPGVNPK